MAATRRAGQIVRRGDRKFVVRVFLGRETGPDGRTVRRLHSETINGTKKDAEARLAELLAKRRRGEVVKPSDETLAVYLTRWLENVASVTLRARTHYEYSASLKNYILPALGWRKVASLSVGDFDALYRDLEARGLSPRTVRLAHAVVHTALEHGVRSRALATNPSTNATLPREVSKKLEVLAPADVRKLCEAADEVELGAAVMFLALTGCRPSEALALSWDAIDLDVGTAQIERTVQRVPGRGFVFDEPKTSRGRRTLVLLPELVEILRRHRTRQARGRLAAGPAWQDLGLVFSTAWGTPLDLVSVKRQGWVPLLKRAGLDQRTPLYRLRHSSVTTSLANGVDVATVAAAHGHDARMTLARYAMPTSTQQRQAADTMGRAIFGATRDQGR